MSGLRIARVGEAALLVETDDGRSARALHAEAVRRRSAGDIAAVDIVPGGSSLLLDGLDPDRIGDVARAIADWPLAAGDADLGPLVELVVAFDGPDLADVAAAWGVERADVAEVVAGTELDVAFLGFAPGFAYLAGLDRHTPRRASPRTVVPAGAVGLAGQYAGIYPRSSPGGWQLIGELAPDSPALWDQGRTNPALLEPGARVRLIPARVRP